ncbi:MAG: diacylglycerol/lipid kinase family protein [Nitrospinota bacterium]
MKPIKKISLLVNPFSGNGRGDEIFEQVRIALHSDASLKERVIYLEKTLPMDDPGLPYERMFHESDIVLIAGGDGTVHHVVNMVKDYSFKGSLAIYPLGTGNDLASALGNMEPDIVEFIRKIIDEPKTAELDIFSLNSDLFFVSFASFGGDASVLSQYERLCNKLYGTKAYRIPYIKYLLYFIPAVKEMLFRSHNAREKSESKPAAAIIVNNLKTYGGGCVFDTESSMSDGKPEIARFFSKLAYLKLIATRTGLLSPSHDTVTMETPFTLEFDSDVPVQVAGEDYSGYFSGCNRFTVAYEGKIKVCI